MGEFMQGRRTLLGDLADDQFLRAMIAARLKRTQPSVQDAFEKLLQRIELNPTRVTDASDRYNAVKRTLEAALKGSSMKQIGSFQRKDKIKPSDLSDALDLDTILDFGPATHVLPPGQGGTTPGEALQRVRRALNSNDTYRVMEPRTDAPVVVLEYQDKFKIEIVPAFTDRRPRHFSTTNRPDPYLIPGADGGWQLADYDYDAQFVSRWNQACDGALIPTIKIAKAFLRTRTKLKSFHIVVLAANTVPGIVATWESQRIKWGYHHLFAAFLEKAGGLLTAPLTIPGSFSPKIDSGLDWLTIVAMEMNFNAWANHAKIINSMGDGPDAVAAWRKFFGDPFPTT